jgi:hypothetical protein
MELAVVVSSCDSFRDAWAPFFYFFAKRWPDCPYPVYLITNHGTYRDPLVRCLPVGRDRGWADNLSLALDRIETPHILYLQEDYFLTRPVHTEHLREDIAFMQRHRAAYLGLYPIPTPEEPVFDSHPRIGRLAAEAAMRVSLQAAVWDVTALRALLRPGETGWDMERLGSDRSRDRLFLRMNSFETAPLDYFFTAIKRGAWEPGAVEMCRQENIVLDLRFRPVRPETKWQRFERKWSFRLESLGQRIRPRHFEIAALPR